MKRTASGSFISKRDVREIDENLHCRQLAVYGGEAMRRIFASRVLISGINGLGAEIEHHVGINRAAACLQKLQKIRIDVTITRTTGQLTNEYLSNFEVSCYQKYCKTPGSGFKLMVVLQQCPII